MPDENRNASPPLGHASDVSRQTSRASRFPAHVDGEISLFDCWRTLVKRKKLIGLLVGGAFVGSIVVSLLLPKIYASTASLLPPQQESSLTAGLGALQLGAGALGGLGGFVGLKSPADLWVGILKSQTVEDAIISRFDLMKIYKAKTIEDARDALNKRIWIRKSKEDIIFVTIEDRDPQRATRMANAFVEELDTVNKNVVMTSGGRMRVFVGKRLGETKEELAKVEEEVRIFQDQYRAVKLDDQSKAMIEAIGKVKGQLMARDVELQTLLSYATPTNPQAEILKSQVDELRSTLRDLEDGEKGASASIKSVFIPTAKIPDLALQYSRLVREAKVQETLYGLLTQQYEIARVQEAKDSPTVQILDIAKVPQKEARPRRVQIALLSTFTALFFSVLLAFFMDSFEKGSNPPVGIKIDLIPDDRVQQSRVTERKGT